MAVNSLKASKLAEFLFEHWICRYWAIRMVTVDGGSEFRDELIVVAKKCGENSIVVTQYYPQGAGIIERGHRPIKDSLVDFFSENRSKWKQNLPLILFPDRISTQRTTGMSHLLRSLFLFICDSWVVCVCFTYPSFGDNSRLVFVCLDQK